MYRVSTRPRIVLTILGILLTTALALVLNLVSGYPGLITWLSHKTWYSLRNLLITSATLSIAAAMVAIWQQLSARRDRRYASLQHAEKTQSDTDRTELDLRKASVQDAELYRGRQLAEILTPNQALMDKESGTQFVEAKLRRIIEKLPKKKRMHKAIIFIDVDKLTQINQHFGKNVGDRVLGVVANLVRAQQSITVCGRCGDDTYFAYLDKSNESKAKRVAEQIRKSVEGFPWWKVCAELKVRCTCGYAVLDPDDSPYDWVIRAIEAMLEGKNQGGNITLAGPEFVQKEIPTIGMEPKLSEHGVTAKWVMEPRLRNKLVDQAREARLSLRRYFS